MFFCPTAEKAEEDELGEIGSPRESQHECAYDGVNFKGADLPERCGGSIIKLINIIVFLSMFSN